MTIGGAIAELQNLINADDVPFYYKGGIEKVIETISMEFPTIEVSEDCISRDWVLNRLTKYQKDYALNELDDWQNTVVEWITTDIENAPSVVPSCQKNRQVERAEGEWIEDNLGTVICSECKRPRRDNRINHTKFCNSCGAKMKGAEE